MTAVLKIDDPAELVDVLCADEHLLNQEFEALVADLDDQEPPGRRVAVLTGAPEPPRAGVPVSTITSADPERRLRDVRRPGRQRSPPALTTSVLLVAMQ